MDKWEFVEHRSDVWCVRDGWAGVWDAIVALWTGERFVVAKPYTLSMWVRIDGNKTEIVNVTLGSGDHTHVKSL